MKNISKNCLIRNKIKILILVGVVLVIVWLFLSKKYDDEIVIADFKIEKGENMLNIGDNLKNEKLIDKKLSFVIYIYKNGLQKEIKAGEYKLNSSLSIQEISEIITKGDIIEENKSIKMTFPEGWNNINYELKIKNYELSGKDFGKLAKDADYFQKKYNYEFLEEAPDRRTLEGFLFPDTYFFAINESAESIIKKMLDNFDKKLSKDLRDEIAKQGKTVYEIITMASILEEEVRTQEDRKIVSGIFWNRLKSGQAFQSCATLAYILGENKKQYSYDDTRIESLYNTYLYAGLPPGPISNPGLDAIESAIYPVNTDYNYFLNNPETGQTVFSKTLDEHNTNKIKNGL